jgi:hypothetical protein
VNGKQSSRAWREAEHISHLAKPYCDGRHLDTAAEKRENLNEVSRRMGMFDTTGTASPIEMRKENTLRKLERTNKTLCHEEPDCVPISDFGAEL